MSVTPKAAKALMAWLEEDGLSHEAFAHRIDAIATVHKLGNSQFFIPAMQVMEWPKEMRDWIKKDRYWQPDMLRDGYVSPCL